MIHVNHIEPGCIVEFIMEGACELDEVLGIMQSEYCKISTGVVWNFTSGSNVNLDTADMKRIAETARKHARHKRTAYVGPADLEFGILRMYEAYAELASVAPAMKVFREREAAIEWIKES